MTTPNAAHAAPAAPAALLVELTTALHAAGDEVALRAALAAAQRHYVAAVEEALARHAAARLEVGVKMEDSNGLGILRDRRSGARHRLRHRGDV